MRWERRSKTVNTEGTTIVYACHRENLTIESRKRHIPHANGQGTWDHTSYFVLAGGDVLTEKQTLKAAQRWAEDWMERK